MSRASKGIARSWTQRSAKRKQEPGPGIRLPPPSVIDMFVPELRRLYGQNLQLIQHATLDADYKFTITNAVGCRITNDNCVELTVRHIDLVRADNPMTVVFEALRAGAEMLMQKRML